MLTYDSYVNSVNSLTSPRKCGASLNTSEVNMNGKIESSLNLNETERAALAVIWQHGLTSRGALSQRLRVSKMQATNIVRALIERGFIVETSKKCGKRGKPTTMIRLASDAAYAVGVNVSRTQLEIGILSTAGQLNHSQCITLETLSVNAVANAVNSYIDEATVKRRITKKRLCGIGFSVNASYAGDGSMTQAYFPQWDGINLQQEFSEQFSAPVTIDNRSACAAWGEKLLGVCKHISNYLFVDIAYGVGGGLVIENKLVRGFNGNAGTLGVPFPVGTVRPSGQDLIDTLRAQGVEIDDLPALRTLSEKHHNIVVQWAKRAAEQLQLPLNIFAGVLDPQAIIVGGQIPHSILSMIHQHLDNKAFCSVTRPFMPVPKLLVSDLAEQGGVAGVASLALAKALFPAPYQTEKF